MPTNYPIQLFRVRSRSTGDDYSLAILSADTDMVTNGLLLLASHARKEIHIYSASSDEFELGPYYGATMRARRENERQGRNDLVGIAIDTNEISMAKPRIEFAFHDLVADGYADVVDSLSVEAFLSDGGTIVDARNV